jgi:tRNA threonylcarbamoyladenosine biosynthesis protein TsaB
MNVLAIDTATATLGLCLKSGSESHTLLLQAGLKHSEKLMPSVRALLLEAELGKEELELITCSIGPGSFTGIRIGLATAKGLALGIQAGGASCRLIGVSTLDGLARRFRRFEGMVVAVNPSLRKKHYAAVYRKGVLTGDYLETTLADLAAALHHRPQPPMLLTGAAATDLYALLLPGQGAEKLVLDDSGQSSDPAGLLECGVAKLEEPLTEPVPLYLRKSEAEITFFGE